jgi:hypothetical protein
VTARGPWSYLGYRDARLLDNLTRVEGGEKIK